jgi:hypothetical protein
MSDAFWRIERELRAAHAIIELAVATMSRHDLQLLQNRVRDAGMEASGALRSRERKSAIAAAEGLTPDRPVLPPHTAHMLGMVGQLITLGCADQVAVDELNRIADRLRRTAANFGIGMIADERARQYEVEGFSVSGDSAYGGEELAMAAACYALPLKDMRRRDGMCFNTAPEGWPFAKRWWKPAPVKSDGQGNAYVAPRDRLRELVKAGALIAAQIDALVVREGLA